MTVEKLQSQILSDAKAEADKVLGEAKKEAKVIKDKSRAEIAEKKKKILDKGKKDAELEKNRILSSARLEIHKMNLAKKEELVQKTFEKTKVMLTTLGAKSKERYKNALKSLVQTGIDEIGATNVELHFNEKDKGLGAEIVKELKVNAGKPVDIEGGVLIKSADGTAQVDHSFEECLKRDENVCRNEVAKILFRK